MYIIVMTIFLVSCMHTYMMPALVWMPEDNSRYQALFYVLYFSQRESVTKPQEALQPPRASDHLSVLTEAQGS